MRDRVRIKRGASLRARYAIAVGAGPLALAIAPAAASADPPQQTTAPPSSLVGEALSSTTSTSDYNNNCTITYSGPATGPYPGTFTAKVTFPGGVFNESFEIDSANGTVKGTKTGPYLSCPLNTRDIVVESSTTYYSATITTPTGAYQTSGAGSTTLKNPTYLSGSLFSESFETSNGFAPTSKDQCKNGGWQNYPQFKNQGDCVSYTENGK